MYFEELGLSFPLWKAPVEDAADYNGVGTCSFCLEKNRQCFNVSYYLRNCACGALNGVAAGDFSWSCWVCNRPLGTYPFDREGNGACFECFRARKVVSAERTTLGFVWWEVIAGKKRLATASTFLVGASGTSVDSKDLVEDAALYTLPPGPLWEVMTTPGIRGENTIWEICKRCTLPMIFMGIEAIMVGQDDEDEEIIFEKLDSGIELDEVLLEIATFSCPSCKQEIKAQNNRYADS